MRWAFLVLMVFAPALAGAVCAPSGAPWISLEIVAGEPAGSEAAQWLEVRRDGCVTLRYASWDLRRGVYQFELGKGEAPALAQRVSSTGVDKLDAIALKARLTGTDRSARSAAIAADKAQPIFAISDGDSYRIEIVGDTGKNLIAWYAPREEARFRPGVVELAKLVDFIDALQTLAASPRRTKVAEVTP